MKCNFIIHNVQSIHKRACSYCVNSVHLKLQSFCLCEKSYSCGSVCYFEGHQSAIIKDSLNMHPIYATGDHIFGIWCTFLTVTHLTTTYTQTIYASLHYILYSLGDKSASPQKRNLSKL